MITASAICQPTATKDPAAERQAADSLGRTTMLRALGFVTSVAAALALGVAPGAAQSTHDLMEGRGRDVSFPVSCGPDIQPRFDAALSLFWYGQALKEFTAIADVKPDCAMAHWGIAISVWNEIRPRRDQTLSRRAMTIARALAVSNTQRERDCVPMRSPPFMPTMTSLTIARAPTPTWSRWSRSHSDTAMTARLKLLCVIAARHCRRAPSVREKWLFKAGNILEPFY